MDHWFTPGLIVDAASGPLLVAIGAVVFFLGPARRHNRSFGVFAMAWGGAITTANLAFVLVSTRTLSGEGISTDLMLTVTATLNVVAAVALARFAFVFPRPMAPSATLILMPVFAAAAILLMFVEWHDFRGPGLLRQAYMASILGVIAILFFVLLLMPLRHARDTSLRSSDRRDVRLWSIAMLLYPGLLAGMVMLNTGLSLYSRLVYVTILVVVASIWLANRNGPSTIRIAWLALAMPLMGMVTVVLQSGYEAALDSGLMGITRVAGAAILGYGILRHQLFGIDLKVKWALKRGGVMAVLGVAFLISKETIEFFLPVEALVPSLIGAALVAALAYPVWLGTVRITEGIMPNVQDTPTYRVTRALEIYRTAVEELAGEGLSSRERRVLDALRAKLGVSAPNAQRIESEVLVLAGLAGIE